MGPDSAQFFFQGHPRWCLGFASPNYAGAFIACLLPLAWTAGRSGRIAWIALAGELAGWVLLAGTGSRGAALAAAAALAYWFLLERRRRRFGRAEIVRWGVKLPLVAAMAAFTTLPGRMASGLAADPSIGNRLRLWREALVMLASSPWRGWGAGDGGFAYMNWFQPLGDGHRYATLVSGWLQLLVERGALAGFATLALTLLPVLAQRRPNRGSSIACGSVVTAWIAANSFSTLSDAGILLVAPVLCGAAAIGRGLADGRLLRPMLASAAVAGGAVLIMAGIGRGLAAGEPIRCVPIARRVVRIVRMPGSRADFDRPNWYLMPDPFSLGPSPGKEMRRLLLSASPGSAALVDLSFSPCPASAARPGCALVTFGAELERADLATHGGGWSAIIAIDPPPAPDSLRLLPAVHGRVRVVLPGFDQAGTNDGWIEAAREESLRISFTRGTGADLRRDWPALLLDRT